MRLPSRRESFGAPQATGLISHCAEFPIRISFRPTSRSGTLERVTSIETGKTFGTNNREQERPNLD
jgi:hypothetical protein